MAANLVDRVTRELTSERVAAAAAVLGQPVDRVRHALVVVVPLLLGALGGQTRRRSTMRQFHADVLSAHVDPLSLETLPNWIEQSRLSPTLHGGHLAARALFDSQIDALASALASLSSLRLSDARWLIDLATAVVLGKLKQLTLAARLDAYQLDELLAGQYVFVATRIDPALTQALGYASAASWLSANGADTVTRHPMAPFTVGRHRTARRLSAAVEQVVFLLLLAFVSVIIYATLTPSRMGLHRSDARSLSADASQRTAVRDVEEAQRKTAP